MSELLECVCGNEYDGQGCSCRCRACGSAVPPHRPCQCIGTHAPDCGCKCRLLPAPPAATEGRWVVEFTARTTHLAAGEAMGAALRALPGCVGARVTPPTMDRGEFVGGLVQAWFPDVGGAQRLPAGFARVWLAPYMAAVLGIQA